MQSTAPLLPAHNPENRSAFRFGLFPKTVWQWMPSRELNCTGRAIGRLFVNRCAAAHLPFLWTNPTGQPVLRNGLGLLGLIYYANALVLVSREQAGRYGALACRQG